MPKSRRFSNSRPLVSGGFNRFVPWPREGNRRVDASAILESLDSAVIGSGLDGTITTWNAAAVRLYGYSPSEVLGEAFDVIVPSPRQSWENEIGKRVAPGRAV